MMMVMMTSLCGEIEWWRVALLLVGCLYRVSIGGEDVAKTVKRVEE
jgi:hypothetical protein